ncbi:MAG: hypothetical protein JXQ73_02485 [Phycisphaerae bacterium]|nr:hypothetical protein [Phycisphaerae bacterium]
MSTLDIEWIDLKSYRPESDLVIAVGEDVEPYPLLVHYTDDDLSNRGTARRLAEAIRAVWAAVPSTLIKPAFRELWGTHGPTSFELVDRLSVEIRGETWRALGLVDQLGQRARFSSPDLRAMPDEVICALVAHEFGHIWEWVLAQVPDVRERLSALQGERSAGRGSHRDQEAETEDSPDPSESLEDLRPRLEQLADGFAAILGWPRPILDDWKNGRGVVLF